ncbi:MAG: hypothetical protein Q8L02_08055 [Candidatus Nitrotoga sp.]|nr:hypothetical protein [Candidatus Nitrotoga sp.]
MPIRLMLKVTVGHLYKFTTNRHLRHQLRPDLWDNTSIIPLPYLSILAPPCPVFFDVETRTAKLTAMVANWMGAPAMA